jgi:hypothetical protein
LAFGSDEEFIGCPSAVVPSNARQADMVILAMFDRLAIFGLVLASLRGRAQCRHAERLANRAMVVRRQLDGQAGTGLPHWIIELPFLPNSRHYEIVSQAIRLAPIAEG